jgi:HSP20 family protein
MFEILFPGLGATVSVAPRPDGLLTVRGEKKLESENRNRTHSERFYGRFERQITLDRDVDDSAVNATFKNGILTVTVPKNARAVERSKRIPINAGKTEGKSH